MHQTMAVSSEINSLAQKVAHLAENGFKNGPIDKSGRRELQDAVRKLGLALETPNDTMSQFFLSPVKNAVVRVCINLGIFESVVKAGNDGISLEELIVSTRVDETILTRILRPLPALGLLAHTDQNRYTATSITETFSSRSAQATTRFTCDVIAPVLLELPAYFTETKYRLPSTKDGPMQVAHKTELTYYEYVNQPEHSSILYDFSIFMQTFSPFPSYWLDLYPFEERIISGSEKSADAVLLVDIGGGNGHMLRGLRLKFPDLPGRLILQDLPKPIEEADNTKKVFEKIIYDFFTPQPIQGARTYHFRRCLHDWSDENARIILRHTAAAMRRGYSKLILNELILPDVGTAETVSSIGIVMLALGGGTERTESHWRRLLASAGLIIEQIWRLDDKTEAVIEAVLS